MKTRLIVLILFLVVFRASENHDRAHAEIRSGEPSQLAPELILQTGHSKIVEALVFSPDNRWAASGSFDNTIRIWDVETGRELRSLTGHLGAIKALTCSPDGKWLASGGNDNTVRIWEVESGKEIKSFSGQGVIESLSFSPDGKKLASGGSAGLITIRDVAAGTELASLAGHTDTVSALTFSPDGIALASGSADQTIKIWDIAKGKLKRTLTGHTDKIGVLRFSENGEILASGSRDQTIRLWKTENGNKLAVLSGHTGKIIALNFASADSLMSADSDRTVKVWNTTGNAALISTARSTVSASAGEAECAAFSSDRNSVATGNGDGTITVSNTKDGETRATLENHTVGYYGATFSPDRHWLASASFDNTVKLWDLQTGRSLLPFRGHTGRVTSIVFHPDSKRIFSASVDHTIRVWNILSTKPVDTLTGHTNSISSLAIGSKGKLLVSGSADQTIGLWDLETNDAPPRFLKGHTGEVISVAISNDERFIVSASIDGTIKIWDTQTAAVVRTIEPGSGEIDAVAFSPDGKLVVSGGVDKLVRVWDAETGRLVQTLPGHTGKINAVSFSPDGKQIISSGQDKTIRTWTASDGRAERVMTGHVGPVFSICYSNDGRFVSSASDDGSVIIWKPETGDRVATLISLKNSEDWLVVTPEGFFDGSQTGWEQLSWRFEKSTFNVKPVEVFFSEFYSPGLLADLLSGGKLPSNSNISNKDRRQPELKLSLAEARPATSATTRDVTVKIDVLQAPAGAKDVRLFRNGALVRVWRGDVLKGQSSVSLDATIPIVAGDNKLTVYAFNADEVKSTDATLIINGPAALTRKGVSYILAIGLNEYANGEYNLNQAVADAEDFAGELKRQQVKLGNFERVEIIALNDENATKANIIRSLADLSTKIQPEDTLTIYFAGHGTAQKNRFYLIPHDLGYNGPRTRLDSIGLQTIISHSISDEELESVVEGLDVGRILLVIDACNSGQALEAEEKRRGPMNSKGLAQLAYEKGMYILTAAQSYQAATEDVGLGHGYLTYALVEEGLKTNLADREPKDGQVLLREWLDFATERVPQIDQEEITKGQKEGRELEREKTKAANAGVQRSPQRPRVFYRREMDAHPLVVARP